MSNNWFKAFSINDIENEEAKEIEIPNGKKVTIFNVNNNFFATDNFCTHEEASLCDGYIDGDTVECPLHQGVFCISTGKALESPATVDLKTYKTKIEDNFVFVYLK